MALKRLSYQLAVLLWPTSFCFRSVILFPAKTRKGNGQLESSWLNGGHFVT